MSEPDRGAAVQFLHAIGAEDGATFQTFDDDPDRRDPALAKIAHGRFQEVAHQLVELSRRGAGVFVAINRTDGRGRRTENVTAVRAVFVDLDGAPIEPCLRADEPPHVAVETSPGRFHAYWKVADLPLPGFRAAQEVLAERFGGDPSIVDLPRVMRLPGFDHQKIPGRPFRVRIVHLLRAPALPASRFAAPAARAADSRAAPLGHAIGAGGRHAALVSLARTLTARGVCREAIVACLAEVNRRQCSPPLEGDRWREVLRAVDWSLRLPVVSPLHVDEDQAIDEEILRMSPEEIVQLMKGSEA